MDTTTPDTTTINHLLTDLQTRATRLLTDLALYRACLKSQDKQKDVEIRAFARHAETEIKALIAIADHSAGGKKEKKKNSTTTTTTTTTALTDPDDDDDDDLGLEHGEEESIKLKRLHTLRSSNLPFYEAVWTVARECRGVVALGKRVSYHHQYHDHDHPSSYPASTATCSTSGGDDYGRKKEKKNKKTVQSAVVDVIANDGLQWIKVSTNTEKRLVFEMAKEGWVGYGDDSNSDNDDGEGNGVQDELSTTTTAQLSLVKLATTLYAASRQTRVRFRHPSVRLMLPKVREGRVDAIDAMVRDIRSIGVEVVCGNSSSNNNNNNEIPTTSTHPWTSLPPLPIPPHILPSPSPFHPQPTQTLNIDCTILLSLISDISHTTTSTTTTTTTTSTTTTLPPHPPPTTSPHYHKTILKQIGAETTSPLLPTEVYPYLTGRTLVCTTHAAQRMREIVQTMGTGSEGRRAEIVLGERGWAERKSGRGSSSSSSSSSSCCCCNSSSAELCDALEAESVHRVPSGMCLPVRIVDPDTSGGGGGGGGGGDVAGKVPTLSAQDVHAMTRIKQEMKLSTINESVFLYGWRQGIVTVTSNRAIAHGLIKSINEILDEQEKSQDMRPNHDDGSQGKDPGIDFQGPLIYVCETARSLIGKEKQG